MLDQIRIVMVNPSHSGNIGSAARAMKNMGLSQLVLVGPKRFPDKEAFVLASGADDLLAEAVVVDSLTEALQGVEVVFGTSARSRQLPWPLLTPQAFSQQLKAMPKASIAVVFGRENSGLTNKELAKCHYHIQIPTVEHFSSLNLSQAVLLLCYEARLAFLDGVDMEQNKAEHSSATVDKIEGFFQHLESTLIAIEFLDPREPKLLMQRLRRLFARARLDQTELHILRGILSRVDRIVAGKSSIK
jgi:tRNA (cytidine32/uridine32-2'-O)-methyltransferase